MGYNRQVTLAEHDLYLVKWWITNQIIKLKSGDNINYKKELDNYWKKVILKLFTINILGFIILLFN